MKMTQQVVVALVTVWLASIAEASVPSGETIDFSTPKSPGPTPDQYTLRLRTPRYDPQDDYGQDWMKDEPSRIKVGGRRKILGQRQTGSTNVDETPLLMLTPHESVDCSRYKSKNPKKVLAVEQFTWKARDPRTWKRVPRIASESGHHPDRFLVSSRSFKKRVFGVGRVPELQVGCEGVEGVRRQKRSGTETPDQNISGAQPNMSARGTKVNIEPDYESEEELEEVAGEDELMKILRQAASTTDLTLSHKNRGDMDPMVEPNRPRKEDKLPTRGDLGPLGEPDYSYGDRVPQKILIEHQIQLTPRRKLLFMDDDLVDNDRSKQSPDQGHGDNDTVMKEHTRFGYHGAQGHRREKRRWRREENREAGRRRNRVGGEKKASVTTGWAHQKEKTNHIKQNRLASVARNEPVNLLLQPSAFQ